MHSNVCLACEMKDLLNDYKLLWQFVTGSFDRATLSLVVASQVCKESCSSGVVGGSPSLPAQPRVQPHPTAQSRAYGSPAPRFACTTRGAPLLCLVLAVRALRADPRTVPVGKPCSWKQSATQLGPSAEHIQKYLSTMHPFLNHVLHFDNFIKFHFNESLIKLFFS